jgi:RimJ/RimL family protein N-acetyltransferase
VQELSREHFAPWHPLVEGTLEERFLRELERAEGVEREGTGCRRVVVVLLEPVREVAFRQPWSVPHVFRGRALTLDGQPIGGFVNLSNVVRGVAQYADMGWSVSAEFIGHGIATEAVTAMLDLAFAPAPAGLGLHRVSAGVIPRNARSIRVAEKAGFRREGLAKKMIRIAGEWEDHILYAKLAEEHEIAYLR